MLSATILKHSLCVCVDTSNGPPQELLNRVEVHNQRMNAGGEKTFLLPMAVAPGSPTHPAYPSGHAINVGAYITTLKVQSRILNRLDVDCLSKGYR